MDMDWHIQTLFAWLTDAWSLMEWKLNNAATNLSSSKPRLGGLTEDTGTLTGKTRSQIGCLLLHSGPLVLRAKLSVKVAAKGRAYKLLKRSTITVITKLCLVMSSCPAARTQLSLANQLGVMASNAVITSPTTTDSRNDGQLRTASMENFKRRETKVSIMPNASERKAMRSEKV